MGAGPSREAGGHEGFVRVRGAEDDAGGGGGGGAAARAGGGAPSARAAELLAGELQARAEALAAEAPALPRDPRAGEAAVTWDSSPTPVQRFRPAAAVEEGNTASPSSALSGRPTAPEEGWAASLVDWLTKALKEVDREQAKLDEGANQAPLLREVMLRARRAKLDTEVAGREAANDARAAVEAVGRCRARLDTVLKSTEGLVRRLEVLEERQGRGRGVS